MIGPDAIAIARPLEPAWGEETVKQSLLCAAAVLLCATGPAFAQSADQDALMQCLGIENDADRLACFDRVASEHAQTSAEAEAVEEEEQEAERESRRFGLPRPSFPSFSLGGLFGGDEEGGGRAVLTEDTPETRILERSDDGDIRRVMMTVGDITTFGHNTLRFHMTNGQIWEVTDGRAVRIPRTQGPLRAEIERGLVGGYLMRLDGRSRAIRVQRIDLASN